MDDNITQYNDSDISSFQRKLITSFISFVEKNYKKFMSKVTDDAVLTLFQTLNGEMEYDYSSFGGLKNNKASSYTGDVNLTLPACASGDSGTVVCEWIKVYES